MAQEQHEKHMLGDNNTISPTLKSSDLDGQAPRQASSSHPDIPIGGKKAWLRVLGGCLAFINVWWVTAIAARCCLCSLHPLDRGFPLCYGVFQGFYALEYLKDKSASSVAWIGTVQNFLVSMVSILSGPIYDLGYYRSLVFAGSFLNVFGIMMLSLSTKYYQLFLSHVCNGVGSGLLYVPILALVAQSRTCRA